MIHPSRPEDLPPNLPIVNLSHEDMEGGWRKVAVGELIHSSHQVFAFAPRPHWRISAFRTQDRETNAGKSNYRAPASLRAWCVVIPQMVGKWYRQTFTR